MKRLLVSPYANTELNRTGITLNGMGSDIDPKHGHPCPGTTSFFGSGVFSAFPVIISGA